MMNERLLVTLPTLGLRQKELLRSISSVLDAAADSVLEVRSPNKALLKSLEEKFGSSIKTTFDSGTQRDAILNSWLGSNGFEWFTWINDDDYLLDSFKASLEAIKSAAVATPTIVFGDLFVDSAENCRIIRTPKKIFLPFLTHGGNYVPGVGTCLNGESVRLILEASSADYRDAFDLEWWLILAKNKARFIHTRAAPAAWRLHEGARTQSQPTVVRAETVRLREEYSRELAWYMRMPFGSKSFVKLLARIAAWLP